MSIMASVCRSIG